MNIRRIKLLRNKSLLGKALRLPFKLIPKGAVVPIMSGPLKSRKWINGSHNVSILFGAYEKRQTKIFVKYAGQSKVFWDLGAHVGYYSLLFQSVNSGGKVYAFEPLPESVTTFKRHMSLNKIESYQIFPVAVFDKEGELTFNKTSTSVAGKLDEKGDTKVPVIKLSDYLASGKLDMPDLIKMDIEGAEVQVLQDLKSMLQSKKPVMFVSTHGKQIHKDCIALLSGIGYTLEPLDTHDLETSKEFLAH